MALFRRTRREDARPETSGEAAQPGPAWTGRPLQLQAAPDPEHAPELAELLVITAKRIDGVDLDYSIGSLDWVDGLLGSFSEPGSDATAETVFSAAMYLGEVMVRVHGFSWTFDDGSLIIVHPSGTRANPVGKAFKRVDNGPTDSVAYFARAFRPKE